VTLKVQDVDIVYPTEDGELVACQNISLSVEPGEFVTIIGPSGCGKSTLLHAMGGMLRPTHGSVTGDGTVVRGPDPHKAAFVFQDYSLLPWKTVMQNVEIGPMFAGVSKKDAHGIALQKLQMVGLEEYRAMYPRQLSGGMQQRVAVARALALEPEYLLMDEPFGALDEQTRRALGVDLGERLSKSGRGVVLITHSLEEAVYWADRVVVLSSRPGRIVKEIKVHGSRPRPLEFMTTDEFAEVRAELFSLIQAGAHEETQ
jgi:NitT/TauT family transport system ATP-binding protein